MKLPKLKLKIDWNLLATLGLGTVVASFFLIFIAPRFGFFAYNGIPTSRIMDVYSAFDKECKLMTRATGKDWLGQSFTRGLYSCNGHMYYYRLDKDILGRTSFFIYPMIAEMFTDAYDFGGLTGNLIYPPTPTQQQVTQQTY